LIVLVGAVVGVGVVYSRPKLPVTYKAVAFVKIGQKVSLAQKTGVSSPDEYIENPINLTATIPLRYGMKAKEIPGYHLDIKKVGAALSMLELILEGPDKGVEGVLKEIIDMMIDDHRITTKASIVAYTNFVRKLEADAKMYQDNIASIHASLKEIKRREGAYLEKMAVKEAQTKKGKRGDERTAFLNMLYLKTIDQGTNLRENQEKLSNVQYQLIRHQTTIGNLGKYKTEMIGKIKRTAVKPKKTEKIAIAVGGVTGLIMSLCIVFLMEYIVESKSRRKGK
jgi:hypothetical protein